MSIAAAQSICILMHDFSAGGTERIAIRLGNRWAASGRTVTIVCGSSAGVLRELVDRAVTVIELAPALVRGLRSRHRLGVRMAPIVAQLHPDIVFIPGNFHIPVVSPLLANLPRPWPSIVVKLSNPIQRDSRSTVGQWLFESRLRQRLRDSCCVVAMAPVLAAELSARTGYQQVISIQEPSLDDDLPACAPMPPSTALVAAGRLVPQKNFQLAIRAVAKLRDPSVQLTIYGEGPQRAELRALALQLGIAERIHLPGYARDFQCSVLPRHRLFLLSSVFEGYPAVAVEALAAGLPVISTDCSLAIRDIVSRPELGTVLAQADAEQLAAAIDARLKMPGADADWIAAQVQQHRIGPIAQQYLALFDRLALSRTSGQAPTTASPSLHAPPLAPS